MREYIQNYLNKREQGTPIPTGALPVIKSLPGIRAVLFDIYGTLLISFSGDVDIAQIYEQNVVKVLKKTGITLLTKDKRKAAACMIRVFIKTIRQIHNEKKKKGFPYPEVNIIDVWKEVLGSAGLKPYLKLPDPVDYREFAFIFELFNNPVSPMPGMNSILTCLSKKRIILGIISNAQFYTPILLNYFITGMFTNTEKVHLFLKDCIFFSYQYLRAKPDQYLFDMAKDKLNEYNISPENILYIGNDMRNDILPAQRAGFRTALFAGDKRSLRMRENDREAGKIKPDVVITELSQLLIIIDTKQ